MNKPNLYDLITTDFTHISAYCERCRFIREIGWIALGRIDLRWTVDELASRLVCQRCGNRADLHQTKAEKSRTANASPFKGPRE